MATEKRLIDANVLTDEVLNHPKPYRKDFYRMLRDAPTMDAVEVVRCKECKHYEEVCGEYTCFHPKMEGGWNSEGGENLRMNPMDFCSYGERKADD